MNIATALNKKYVDYTIVMLYSLAVNQEEDVDAYLLHSELEEADEERLRWGLRECENLRVHFLEVDASAFSDRCPRNEFWSLETYYRLMLLDLLPADMDRILYLDVDMIINGSLSEIYHMDLSAYELVSCVNANGDFGVDQMTGRRLELLGPIVEAGYEYFNAGIILFHLDVMRGKYDFDYYMDLARDVWNYEMEAPDQDLLNYAHHDKVGYIDDIVYDLFSRKAHNKKVPVEDIRKGVRVIHYAGDKPWNTTNCHYDNEIIWWEYAKQTPVYTDLLEAFVEQTITDNRLEKEIEKLTVENMGLKKSLQEITAMVKKLTGVNS